MGSIYPQLALLNLTLHPKEEREIRLRLRNETHTDNSDGNQPPP